MRARNKICSASLRLRMLSARALLEYLRYSVIVKYRFPFSLPLSLSLSLPPPPPLSLSLSLSPFFLSFLKKISGNGDASEEKSLERRWFRRNNRREDRCFSGRDVKRYGRYVCRQYFIIGKNIGTRPVEYPFISASPDRRIRDAIFLTRYIAAINFTYIFIWLSNFARRPYYRRRYLSPSLPSAPPPLPPLPRPLPAAAYF